MKIMKCDVLQGVFDYGFIGLGYETRCLSSIINHEITISHLFALGYSYSNNVFQYQENKRFLIEQGASIIEMGKENLYQLFNEIIGSIDKNKNVRVFVDISVMTRQRLSLLIWLLCEQLKSESEIVVFYRIAKYVDPPNENYPVCALGPILPSLVSMNISMSRQIAIVMGLGYERDKALGAIGGIDTDDVYFFIPVNKDKRYQKQVFKNNKLLLQTYRKNDTITYDVTKPYSTYIELRSLILGLRKQYRVLLVPLGPKILSVISILVARDFNQDVNVWRVSSEEKELPLDRESSDEYALLKIVI